VGLRFPWVRRTARTEHAAVRRRRAQWPDRARGRHQQLTAARLRHPSIEITRAGEAEDVPLPLDDGW